MSLPLAPSCHRFLAALRRGLLLPLLLLALLSAAPALADPTGRVGRVAWLSGSVHLHRADSGESSNALLNWPLTSGDMLSTAAGARSEVQLGSTSVQLDASTILEFLVVDDQHVRLRLLAGSVMLRLRSPDATAEFELSTRDGSFSFPEVGSYRFDAEPSATVATVHGGRLRFRANDRAIDLSAGQRAQIWNDGRTRYQVSAPVEDGFLQWSAGRGQRPASAAYDRYVSPEMTGAADLDAHGRWYDSTEYGPVWFPQAVAADWAPYRNGRWIWVDPWGWTWVGDEPWGFAPFHYGRWVVYGGAWGWVPGTRVARPVYAPALVAWVGSPGAAVSVQVGARPAVGWFPLAPREVYVPPYRSSARHVRQVNVTHVTQINNITTITNNPQAAVERMPYAHRQLPRAVTMVPADVVAQQRPIDRAAMLPREGKSLDAHSVQVQAPVGVPPVEGARGREGRRPIAEDGRQRDAAAARGEAAMGGRANQPQQPPAARPTDVAIDRPQPATAPAPVAAPPAPSAAPAGVPPPQLEALPSAGTPSSAPADGQRPEAGPVSERARLEREAGRVSRSEQLGGRGELRRQAPLPGVASPIDAGSSAVPLVPPAAPMPPGTTGTTRAPAAVPVGAPRPAQVPEGGDTAALPSRTGPSDSRSARPAVDAPVAGEVRVPPAPSLPVRIPASPPAVAIPSSPASAPARTAATPERPDRVPTATAVRGAQGAERPAAAAEQSLSGAVSGRPQERSMPPAPPVPESAPSPTSPRFSERQDRAVHAPGTTRDSPRGG